MCLVCRMSVKWDTNGGITRSSHQSYLKDLCDKFTELLKSLIDKAMAARHEASNDVLYKEVSQHLAMVQQRCSLFHGRQEVLSQVQKSVREANHQPIVLYGASGTGKTSVMAMLIKLVCINLINDHQFITYVNHMTMTTTGQI